MERYICIHGHFYQPPRENPWLEAVEIQDSAYPYHDWNERITAECYAPNATSRILDRKGRINSIVNNYARISFDFGPTLLTWLEGKAPEVYAAILEADRQGCAAFAGHGPAMAQAYNHMILPLAETRDKRTQIIWGIEDFVHRFGRAPEGMWLPETAVDLESLDIMADLGIRFTILAPHQAERIRQSEEEDWIDASGQRIDPSRAYRIKLPSGRELALFFYDGPISRAVAFEKILNHGEDFAHRLLEGFSDERTWPQIVHIATDGESYGHHHPHGDMALAYALEYLTANNLARITTYGEYLAMHPPVCEVEIFEHTSWSCMHGLERWRGDCGCNSGGRTGWNQGWRTPLRQALDLLRDALAPAFELKARELFTSPWQARDAYIHVILDRSQDSLARFLDAQAQRPLNSEEKTMALNLMELQRHAMLMYTSCGWFFDDISGIETVQIIQYAGRVLQLAQDALGNAPQQQFLEVLEQAHSNLTYWHDGRLVFERGVQPAMLDLAKVCAHYAMSSLFEEYDNPARIFSYCIERLDYHRSDAGRAKLAIGRAIVRSDITLESRAFIFCALHFGVHNLTAGVQPTAMDFGALVEELTAPFNRGDITQTLRLLDEHFGPEIYDLRTLFRDEQRKIISTILEGSLVNAEALYRQIYDLNAPFMRFLKDLGQPAPHPLYYAAEYVLNANLKRSIEVEHLGSETVKGYLAEAGLQGIALNAQTLEIVLRRRIERLAQDLLEHPDDLERLRELKAGVELIAALPFEVNLQNIQNACFAIMQGYYLALRPRQDQDDLAREWVTCFEAVCRCIAIALPVDENQD